MINFIIIDDEPSAIEVLKIHASKLPFMVLKSSFRDPLAALEYLQHEQVDLIFLDINMPKVSGIKFPQFLTNPPLIIFTTAYSEYALKSYELNAVDYLLKPIEFDRLLQAIMKVKKQIEKVSKPVVNQEVVSQKEQTIFVKSGTAYHQLAYDDIKYAESEGNYVTFFTQGKKIVGRYKLSEVADLLPQSQFIRIHR